MIDDTAPPARWSPPARKVTAHSLIEAMHPNTYIDIERPTRELGGSGLNTIATAVGRLCRTTGRDYRCRASRDGKTYRVWYIDANC